MIRPRVANKRLLNFTPGSYNNREQIDDCDCYQIHTPQCSRIFDVLAIRKVLFISFKETHPIFVLLKITSQGVNTQDCQDKGCIPFFSKKFVLISPSSICRIVSIYTGFFSYLHKVCNVTLKPYVDEAIKISQKKYLQ